jgi:hypothetical protein
MRKYTFLLTLILAVPLLHSCAARTEEPPPIAETEEPAAVIEQMVDDPGRVEVPEPRPQEDPDRENYILRSDTAWLTRDGSTVWLSVRGPLGNGCQRFEYMDSVARDNTLFLTFFASRPKDPHVICTELMQGYDKEIKVENSTYTRFTVIQPDGKTKSFDLSDQASR